MSTSSPPLSTLGVLCALAASFAFTLNDVGIKFLSGDYPLHQIVLSFDARGGTRPQTLGRPRQMPRAYHDCPA